MNREANGIQQDSSNPVRLASSSGGVPSAQIRGGAQPTLVRLGSNAPPLPARQRNQLDPYGGPLGTWRPPGTYYNPMSSYFGATGYSPYGGAGFGAYNWQRRGDEYENRFIQAAEESSAPAFQSVETLVRSFSSVAMMLESTYQAMYTSFRAVLSVAENLSRLRGLLSRLLPTLALLRTLAWFYRRVLAWLGLMKLPSTAVRVESAWQEAVGGAAESLASSAASTPGAKGPPSGWPVLALFGVLMGAPYVIFRLASSAASKSDGEPSDESAEPRRAVCATKTGLAPALALYDFDTEYPNELGFRKGQKLLVQTGAQASPAPGWLFAFKDNKKGIVPANRIALIKNKPQIPSVPAAIQEEPVVPEPTEE